LATLPPACIAYRTALAFLANATISPSAARRLRAQTQMRATKLAWIEMASTATAVSWVEPGLAKPGLPTRAAARARILARRKCAASEEKN
jgi:hypothetical protein